MRVRATALQAECNLWQSHRQRGGLREWQCERAARRAMCSAAARRSFEGRCGLNPGDLRAAQPTISRLRVQLADAGQNLRASRHWEVETERGIRAHAPSQRRAASLLTAGGVGARPRQLGTRVLCSRLPSSDGSRVIRRRRPRQVAVRLPWALPAPSASAHEFWTWLPRPLPPLPSLARAPSAPASCCRAPRRRAARQCGCIPPRTGSSSPTAPARLSSSAPLR